MRYSAVNKEERDLCQILGLGLFNIADSIF